MPGGSIQLIAYGSEDIYLTGDPQITFFIAVYKRHGNFAMEQVRQYFVGKADFGSKAYVELEQKADLVHEMYLNVRLPSLNSRPQDNPDYFVSYVNGIGNALIRYVDVEIGGLRIDRHYGQWLQIYSEFTVVEDKKYAYNVLVGQFETFDVDSNPGPYDLYVPLQFWFNRNIGLSLPLVAIQEQKVRIVFQFNDLSDLWVSSNGNAPGKGGEDSSVMTSMSFEFAYLWVNYIYLDKQERKRFSNCNIEYLIDQLQISTQSINSNEEIITIPFTNSVKELIWVIQTDDIFTQGAFKGIDFFDFSNGEEPEGDTMVTAKIQFNGEDRFEDYRDAVFFRVIQPYQHHTRVPRNFIYNYSFAIKPEEHQPSGTCNFSMIDRVTLLANFDPRILPKLPQLNIYGVNYNVLRIQGGSIGLLYYD